MEHGTTLEEVGRDGTVQQEHRLEITMFVPEGKYYWCNKCGVRFWGIAFRVEGKPGVYCLDCKGEKWEK